MYNLFQYINEKHKSSASLKKTKQETEYQLRHEEFKKYAFENMKERADEFLYNQTTAENPFVFEDDHYRAWRRKRQFRDVENAEKFIGFKTFRHRPNEDMDKFYTPRERKEMEELAARKEDLVRSGVLTRAEVSRSQRSQGPLNPKIEFRVTKNDEEYLQPRLRFANVTDKQRMSESATNFEERVQKIYKKFEAGKDKLGRMMKSSMSRYYNDKSNEAPSGQSHKKSQLLKDPLQANPEQDNERDMSMVSSTKMSQYFQQRNQARRKSKTYFKLSKTMQMLHPDQQKRLQFDTLLKRSQYDRSKDLHNIKHNTFNENHTKDPIL